MVRKHSTGEIIATSANQIVSLKFLGGTKMLHVLHSPDPPFPLGGFKTSVYSDSLYTVPQRILSSSQKEQPHLLPRWTNQTDTLGHPKNKKDTFKGFHSHDKNQHTMKLLTVDPDTNWYGESGLKRTCHRKKFSSALTITMSKKRLTSNQPLIQSRTQNPLQRGNGGLVNIVQPHTVG